MSNNSQKEDRKNSRTSNGYTFEDVMRFALAKHLRKLGQNFMAELIEKDIRRKT